MRRPNNGGARNAGAQGNAAPKNGAGLSGGLRRARAIHGAAAAGGSSSARENRKGKQPSSLERAIEMKSRSISQDQPAAALAA